MENFEIMLSEETIQKRVADLGQEIAQDFKNESLVMVATLKGSIVFFADLIRKIDLPLKVDFIRASSYGHSLTSSGVVRIGTDVSQNLEGCSVIVVEDIVDTGLTLATVLDHLKLKKPKTIKLCSLLRKPDCLKTDVPVDYLGFDIENKFVVGYGLDAYEEYRQLPYVAVLPEDKIR